MHRTPLFRRVRCVAIALGVIEVVLGCSPPPPMAARPTGDAFSAARLYHDGAPWTAPGIDAAVTLSSSEPRFGGWSGVALQDGTLTAVSDRGYWLRVQAGPPTPDGVTFSEPRFGVLPGLDGDPLRRGQMRDAEEIVALPDGSHLVTFEREHRLWLYPPADPPFSAPPVDVPLPEGHDAAYNSGFEAMARLPDGRIITFLEGDTGRGRTKGWIGTPTGTATLFDWHPVDLALSDGYRPTGAAVAANGDLLVLERYFAIPFGFSSRVRRIPADSLVAGGSLDGPVVLTLAHPPVNDNFEAIATAALPDGTTQVVLISDDNYSGLQRTLLVFTHL